MEEEGTRQTIGFSFHTEGATGGQTNLLALVNDQQASILTFPERGTTQTNELNPGPIAEEGTGQFYELSRPAEEGDPPANGLSSMLSATGHTTEVGADKTNGLSHPTLGGDEQVNGRHRTEAGTGQNNWRSHPCNGIDAESIRLIHPTEESAEHSEELNSPSVSGNGTSSGIQERGVVAHANATQSPAIYGNQAGRLNASVQETGQPNSHGLLSCYQQISDNQLINAVSCMATTERDQATVHQCSMEDHRLWSQLLTRHVSLQLP